MPDLSLRVYMFIFILHSCLVLESMLKRGVLVDVTLSCEGKSMKVHRAILSACSTYFENLFIEMEHPHPIIILKDVKSEELKSLVDVSYHIMFSIFAIGTYNYSLISSVTVHVHWASDCKPK